MRAFHTVLLAAALLSAAFTFGAAPALAQHIAVDQNGNWVVVEGQWGGLGQTTTPYEDYFGNDADAMRVPVNVAIENSLRDRFRWEAKLDTDQWYSNSCSAASENIINDVIGGDLGTLPPGWEIRQLGTLGNLTSFENVVGEGVDIGVKWWNEKTYNNQFDPTNPSDYVNPPSYAHTTTAIKSADGDYYIVDNWHGYIEVKKIYPVGDVPDDEFAEFFASEPGETLNLDAEYRLHLSELGKYFDDEPGPDDPVNPPEVQIDTPPPSSEPTEVEVLTSADPNDKYGLQGAGDAGYFSPAGPLDYVIRFENMPDASAPAQEVLIRDTLDTSVFDLRTFRLGAMSFSGRTVPVPPGVQSFSRRVPLGGLASGTGPFEVLITASLVEATGIVTWRFTTLDRTTSDLPFDPLDGFLPPNQTAPEGEGSVSFSVQPRASLSNGTVLRNQARIIFDLNEPIDTPPWINTVDIEPPVSAVALDPIQTDSAFTVTWSGTDTGSGVRYFDVFVSVDEGEYFQWLRQTPAPDEVFVGENGSTYAFYSIAYDATGNVEPQKTEPDVVTAVSVANEDEASLPERVTLTAPYPNPVMEVLTVPFGLPAAAQAEIEVFDMLGRRVAQLAVGDHAAGWHTLRWDVRRLASGVYVLRLRADGVSETRRVTVIH